MRRVAKRASKVWISCALPRDATGAIHLARAPQDGEPGGPRPEWPHLHVCPSADPSSTGIRLRQANSQDEDFQERALDMFLAPEVAAVTHEERDSGRQDAFDELHGCGTL